MAAYNTYFGKMSKKRSAEEIFKPDFFWKMYRLSQLKGEICMRDFFTYIFFFFSAGWENFDIEGAFTDTLLDEMKKITRLIFKQCNANIKKQLTCFRPKFSFKITYPFIFL